MQARPVELLLLKGRTNGQLTQHHAQTCIMVWHEKARPSSNRDKTVSGMAMGRQGFVQYSSHAPSPLLKNRDPPQLKPLDPDFVSTTARC